MADRIRHFSSRSGCIPLLFLVVLLGACASPEALERRLDELQPVALDAAKERARTDLGCEESIATSVISRSPGESGVYSIDRAEYKIAASGCSKRILLTVACTKNRLCSALAQDAVVQRLPQK